MRQAVNQFRLRLFTLGLCLVAATGPDSATGQTFDTLMVGGFLVDVSEVYRNEFHGFAASLNSFTPIFLEQLRSSKAIECAIVETECDTARARSIFASSIPGDSVLGDVPPSSSYFVGRIWDDTSNIAFVDARLYGRRRGRVNLLARLHAEGSQAEAFARGVNLADYLIAQMVAQVEARLDQRIRVLVAPFQYRGDAPGHEALGDMISSLLRSRLTVSQRLRVIVHDSVSSAVWMNVSRDSGQYRQWTLPEIGRREAAKYLIRGSCYMLGNKLIVEASEIDFETGRAVLGKTIVIDSLSVNAIRERMQVLGDDIRSAIEFDYERRADTRRIRLAVVAVRPYPPRDFNKSISLDVAHTVRRKLGQLSALRDSVVIVSDEDLLARYVDGDLDKAVMGRELNADYLWIVSSDRPVPFFNLRFELYGVRDPSVNYSFDSTVAHLDDLDGVLSGLARKVVERWTLLRRTPLDWAGTEAITYPKEVWGLRVRGNLVGLLSCSKRLFLGNHLRQSFDLSGILYLFPLQLEVTADFDMGKTSGGISTRGRYFTLMGRWNFTVLPGILRDMREYVGLGPSLLNFEYTKDGFAHGVVVGGMTASAGCEVLLWRKLYCDFHFVSFRFSFAPVAGFDGDLHPQTGNLISFSMGLGLGYRF